MTLFSRRQKIGSPLGSCQRATLACVAIFAAFSLGGCASLIAGPEPEAPPPIFQKPTLPVFDAADNITAGVKLPGVYRVTSVLSGELMMIQGVTTTMSGTVESKQYGVPETVRLAGIVAPAPGQPGWQSAVAKVNQWLAGKENLTVETDAKFPIDLDNHRMVQIYFPPGPAPKPGTVAPTPTGALWNLNRMLIHTGYAVVDLFGATSIDIQKWLNDEEFAKTFVDPKKPTIEVLDPMTGQKVTKPNIQPLGLWKLGIVIPQRGTLATVQGTTATGIMTSPTTSTRKPGVIGSKTPAKTRATPTTQSSTRTKTRSTSTKTETTARALSNNAANVSNAANSNVASALPTPR